MYKKHFLPFDLLRRMMCLYVQYIQYIQNIPKKHTPTFRYRNTKVLTNKQQHRKTYSSHKTHQHTHTRTLK